MTGFRLPKVEREYINTTASITLSPGDVGKTVGNVGASGSVTITLPAVAGVPMGGDIVVLSCADQNIAVATANTGELIALNDVAANSVTLSTAGEKAGGAMIFTAVGSGTAPTKWHASFMLEETQTVTVAT